MALDLPPPVVPHLNDYGDLDLEALQGQAMRSTIQATSDGIDLWLHPLFQGTTRNGTALDWRPPPRLIVLGTELFVVDISYQSLSALDQGHAVYSYTVQPEQQFEHGYEESVRVAMRVGSRHYPGAGLNVASIKEAHELQFDHTDVMGSGAMVAIAPWQAMRAGDELEVVWITYRQDGGLIGETHLRHTVTAQEVGLPVRVEIARSLLVPARNGRGMLHYVIEYVGGGRTVAPTQTFILKPASADRLPALELIEHSGGAIDPGLVSDGLTFRIPTYSQLQAGDSLIISAEDATTGVAEFITGIRLDRSSVDSHLLQARVEGNWLEDYLDRDIKLGYQVARPGMGLAGAPLILPVRATMSLPPPVVDRASGVGQGEGEFKAEDTTDGIRVRVPTSAVYPQGARVEMHWEGFPGTGSEIITAHNGASRPTFVVNPSVVAPNIGKTVKVFYRVTANGDAPRDSQIFTLAVRPMQANRYPTLRCLDAVNGELRVNTLPAQGAAMTVAPWPLIALNQHISVSVTGTLRTGMVETNEFVKDLAVTNTTSPLSVYLNKGWLTGLAPNSTIELTVTVTADDGATQVTFPRVYIKIIATM
jgi:hypothetical protein